MLKTQSKRKLSGMLAFLMIVSLFSIVPVRTFAAEIAVNATPDSATLTQSDQDQSVKVSVELASTQDYCSAGFTVALDDALTLTAITDPSGVNSAGNYNLANGMYNWITDDVEDISSKLLGTVELTVPGGTKAGTYTVNITDIQVSKNYGLDLLDVPETTSATLTIKEAAGDTSSLTKAITDAKAKLSNATVSADGLDVAKSDQWVTQSDKDTLQKAIDAAQKVSDSKPGQSAVDKAKSDLDSAVAAFEKAKKPGNKADKTNLDKLISQAKSTADKAVVSKDGSDVDSSEKWVTQAAVDELQKAIGEAQKVTANSKPSQADVSSAEAALQKAIDQFTASEKNGTKEAVVEPDPEIKEPDPEEKDPDPEVVEPDPEVVKPDPTEDNKPEETNPATPAKSDTAALKSSIEQAEKAVKDAVVSTDGTDIAKEQQWVPKETMDALNSALDAARKTADRQDATQAQIDAAKQTLDDAVTAFNAAKKPGIYEEVQKPAKQFKDVVDGAWYEEAVYYDAAKGYFKGLTDDTFGPDVDMTRGMFVTVLGRIAGVDTAKYSGKVFDDVDPAQYYGSYVAWAQENGIVTGYDANTFGPNDVITREQMAAIIYRYAKFTGIDVSKISADKMLLFKDAASVSNYAKEAVAWATDQRLLNGTGNGIEPKRTATRAQVAQIIMNYDKLLGL